MKVHSENHYFNGSIKKTETLCLQEHPQKNDTELRLWQEFKGGVRRLLYLFIGDIFNSYMPMDISLLKIPTWLKIVFRSFSLNCGTNEKS